MAYQPHIVAALVASAAIAASLHILLNKRDPRAAALWIGMVWLVPMLGAVLYVLLGINRMPRRAARRALATRQAQVLAEHITAGSSPREHIASPLVVGNKITPLRGGDVAYAAMMEAVDAAEDTVIMSTYIFDHDRAGTRFRDTLKAAVDRGVEVRVLIDAVGARYSVPSMIGSLKRAGVQVTRFSRSLWPWRWRYANMRNHRKLLIVDGRIGFVGGMNIREDCLLELEPRFPTLDLHARVDGPVVAELQRVMLEDWAFCTGQVLDAERYFPPLSPCGSAVARAIADGPDDPADPILWARLIAVARARRKVRIATPYFVPEPAVITALATAARKGVDVEILVPSVNNLRLVAWAAMPRLAQLVDHGCRVFAAAPPFDHMKMMLVDEDWAVIGSANWDARSFRLNFEIDLECRDLDLATELHALFDERLDGARELTREQLSHRNVAGRLRDGAASLLAPYL